jgi:hypothetical protein
LTVSIAFKIISKILISILVLIILFFLVFLVFLEFLASLGPSIFSISPMMSSVFNLTLILISLKMERRLIFLIKVSCLGIF